jgi:hypothetical protein
MALTTIIITATTMIVKVKCSCYTPWRCLGWEEVWLLLILNLGTRWGWVVSITPRPRFTPRERISGTHCTGGWVGPRASPDAEARGKILCLCRGSNPSHPAHSQTLYWLSYFGYNNDSNNSNNNVDAYDGGQWQWYLSVLYLHW